MQSCQSPSLSLTSEKKNISTQLEVENCDIFLYAV